MEEMSGAVRAAALGLALGLGATGAAAECADLTPFGRLTYWTGSNPRDIQAHPLEARRAGSASPVWLPGPGPGRGEFQIGVEWDEPRDVASVRVVWDGPPPAAEALRLEYWHLTWPTPFSGGWTPVDDPYRGRWAVAAARVETDGASQRATCLLLDRSEFDPSFQAPKIPRAEYRRAIKFRLVVRGEAPPVRAFEACSPYPWTEASVSVQFGEGYPAEAPPGTPPVAWDGAAEVDNGALLETRPLRGGSAFRVAADGSWTGSTQGKADGLLLRLRIVDNARQATDQTRVTLRTKERALTFAVDDLLSPGRVEGVDGAPLDVKDCGVFIALSGKNDDVAAYRARVAALAGRTIYDRVLREPEQSYARAAREIPQLMPDQHRPYGLYLPLGPPRSRQEFAIRHNGDLLVERSALMRPGRENRGLRFRGNALHYHIGTGPVPAFREKGEGVSFALADDCLPVVTAGWEEGGLRWTETAFAAFLDPADAGASRPGGDEPTACFVRLVASNPSPAAVPATVWLRLGPRQALRVEDGLLLATAARPEREGEEEEAYDPPLLRAAVLGVSGTLEAVPLPGVEGASGSEAVRWRATVPPKESVTLEMVIPFGTDGSAEERERLEGADLEGRLRETLAAWRGFVGRGAVLRARDPVLYNLSRAVFPHIAVSADPDVDTGHLILPAATFGYAVCADEAGFQIRALDRWGYHREAEDALQAFLDLQGSSPLDGRFASQEGVLRGLRVVPDFDYETFRYSLTHGYLMMALGDHYKMTRDRAWLERAAPKLVAACDFVTRERQATKTSPFEVRPPDYGLLPPCHLDDNVEWQSWYCVNAYACRGMQWIGEALADAGHPEAERVRREAVAFREDLRRAIFASVERSPVVRLRDGTAVPHVPVRARLRGRDLGWIREPLYGPFQYIYCGVLDPGEPVSTWTAKDHEDNLFVDPRWGRSLPSEDLWFSHGGITIQCNLLPNPVVYLDRDQIEHAIRGVYNGLAASLYPGGVYAFAEHPVKAYGYGVGPFYKTPDESGMLLWYRELLVHEEGDRLVLAKGAPRAWLADGQTIEVAGAPTWFGPVTYRIESRAGTGTIRASVVPPSRNRPREVLLRLRHPERRSLRGVTLDGGPWERFDAEKEWIVLPLEGKRVEVEARY